MKEGVAKRDEKIKEDTQLLLSKHNQSGDYEREYMKFFEKCSSGVITHFNKFLGDFKRRGLSDEAAREALAQNLSQTENIQNMVGRVSSEPAYLFEETDLSNEVMFFVLSKLFDAEEVLKAMKDDATANAKKESYRCLITLPCKLTYMAGNADHVVFVALSGYVENKDENNPLQRLHQIIEGVINNLHYDHPEYGSFKFRYIETASRRYDILLQQVNAALSETPENFSEDGEATLSNTASKGCAEKKIFSEVAKHHMTAKEKHIKKLFAEGITNVCLPGINYLENPGTIEELQLREEKAMMSKKTRSEEARLKECVDALEINKKKLETAKAALAVASSQKQIKRLQKDIGVLQEKRDALVKQEVDFKRKLEDALAVLGKQEVQDPPKVNNAMYIPVKDGSSLYLPCWRMPACSYCQEHKLSYLGILYQSSQTYMPVYNQGSSSSSSSSLKRPAESSSLSLSVSPIKFSGSPSSSSSSSSSGKYTPETKRTLHSSASPAGVFFASPMAISPAQVNLPTNGTPMQISPIGRAPDEMIAPAERPNKRPRRLFFDDQT